MPVRKPALNRQICKWGLVWRGRDVMSRVYVAREWEQAGNIYLRHTHSITQYINIYIYIYVSLSFSLSFSLCQREFIDDTNNNNIDGNNNNNDSQNNNSINFICFYDTFYFVCLLHVTFCFRLRLVIQFKKKNVFVPFFYFLG